MIKSFDELVHTFRSARQLAWPEIFACKAGIPVCPECGGLAVAVSGAEDAWPHGHCHTCKYTEKLEAFYDGQIQPGSLRHGQRLLLQCPICGVGSQMVARSGSRGWFLGCSNYPACRNTLEIIYTGGHKWQE